MHDPYAWPLDPDGFLVIPALCIAYALLARTHRTPPWRLACFAAGMLLLLAVFATPLETLAPTIPFPGTLGVGVSILYNGSPPTAPTPWVTPQDHYTGQCVESNGANVLMISPIGAARTLTPVPDATWGLHLADGNIALGNLVDDVRAETKAYLKQRAKRK